MLKPQVYRDVIDELIDVCRQGQGQIYPQRIRAGVWNPHATEDDLPDQHQINLVLARLSEEERNLLARILEEAFSGGVFEALKALEQFEIEPFVDGYEGSAHHDFVGRLAEDQWPWPKDSE